jgi:hypothetical protein
MPTSQPDTSGSPAGILREHSTVLMTGEGLIFRDLNHNGKLDRYEDPRQPLETRIEDMLGQMTL